MNTDQVRYYRIGVANGFDAEHPREFMNYWDRVAYHKGYKAGVRLYKKRLRNKK